MKYVFALAAAAAAMAPMPAFAATNIVVNGSFENPTVAPPCCNTVNGPSGLPGWTVTPNVNVVIGTYGSTNGNLAYDGSQYLDLVGEGGTGSISQMINTVLNQTYQLTFAYSHNLFNNNAPPPETAAFSIGTLNGVLAHTTGNTSDLDWQIFTGTFVGTGSPMNLSFLNLTGGENEGIFLDGISITATPEPSTWLMLILGFGLAGSSIRSARRRKAGVFA